VTVPVTQRTLLTAIATVAIGLAVGATHTLRAAEESQPPATAFTAQQAAQGKSAFEKNCVACHMHDLSGDAEAPQLAGAQFMSTWRTRTTKDLLEYMSTAMPPGGIALSADVYASIASYVLQSNGAKAGAEPLSAATVVPIGRLVPEVK
jgi:mono/diheme cytochrome c family protein